MIEIDLSKQQALEADPKAIQQIDLTGNLDWGAGINVFYYWRSEKKVLDFSQGTNCKSILILFLL